MVQACLETLFSISDLVGRLMRANAICDLRRSDSNRVCRLMRSTCYAIRETELRRELRHDMIAIRGYLNSIETCAARSSCTYRVGRSPRVMFNWKIGRPNFELVTPRYDAWQAWLVFPPSRTRPTNRSWNELGLLGSWVASSTSTLLTLRSF